MACPLFAATPPSYIQLASGQLEVSFQVFLAGPACHFYRKGGGRRLLVPVNLLKVIANVLLVIRILCPTRRIFICRPEARRIRCQNFIR